MANRLLTGQQWLNKRMGQYASTSLVYHYGTGVNDFCVIEGAWQGRTAFRITDKENSRVIWNEADFLIPVDKLATDVTDTNTRFVPKKGHWLEFVDQTSGTTYIMEISAPDGEQSFRYSDSERTRF